MAKRMNVSKAAATLRSCNASKATKRKASAILNRRRKGK